MTPSMSLVLPLFVSRAFQTGRCGYRQKMMDARALYHRMKNHSTPSTDLAPSMANTRFIQNTFGPNVLFGVIL